MFETKEGVIKPIVYVGIINKNKLLLVDYVQAPNPSKLGWWIPAPGLDFGADPREKAQRVCDELGLRVDDLRLEGIESFVLPGGWHFICHYVARTSQEPQSHPNVRRYRWVRAEELSGMTDIAHGKWEIGVGTRYLSGKSKSSTDDVRMVSREVSKCSRFRRRVFVRC